MNGISNAVQSHRRSSWHQSPCLVPPQKVRCEWFLRERWIDLQSPAVVLSIVDLGQGLPRCPEAEPLPQNFFTMQELRGGAGWAGRWLDHCGAHVPRPIRRIRIQGQKVASWLPRCAPRPASQFLIRQLSEHPNHRLATSCSRDQPASAVFVSRSHPGWF
jgi:hypothetical protein